MLGAISFLTKALMGSVSVCRLILGSGLLHVAPLISLISPCLNGLGDMKGILQCHWLRIFFTEFN